MARVNVAAAICGSRASSVPVVFFDAVRLGHLSLFCSFLVSFVSCVCCNSNNFLVIPVVVVAVPTRRSFVRFVVLHHDAAMTSTRELFQQLWCRVGPQSRPGVGREREREFGNKDNEKTYLASTG